MTHQRRYYLGNLQKNCNIVCPKTQNIMSLQKIVNLDTD